MSVNPKSACLPRAAAIVLAVLVPCTSIAQSAGGPAQENVKHVPAFDLPLSSLLDPRDRDFIVAYEARREETKAKFKAEYSDCMRRAGLNPEQSGNSACVAYAGTRLPLYLALRERFPVNVSLETIAGIPVEIFEPRAGIDRRNRNRVLINLHGGGFTGGSRISSHLESIPIAALGRYRVVSIDYRYAPEVKFPAASKDVAAIYRELLKRYKPANIGIFGCSAGGLLTAETVAWLDRHKIPLPGAVAISGAGAGYYQDGDSIRFSAARDGWSPEGIAGNPYFGSQTINDPLAFPLQSDAIMRRFPPSLFLTATRDLGMSSAVKSHQTLTRLGRETDLHVWEGLGHCFANVMQPAADEYWAVTVNFFNKHLGK